MRNLDGIMDLYLKGSKIFLMQNRDYKTNDLTPTNWSDILL